MTWVGKLVGGAFGFMMGGPLGAVLGATLGHRLDRNAGDLGLIAADLSAGGQQRARMAFFTATFSVMGHIAKADGRVTEAEIEAARDVMRRMDLPDDLRRTAIQLFNEGKRAGFPLDATLEQFRLECQRRHALFRLFVEIQLEAALADGALRVDEERLLLHLCERLRFSRFDFYDIKTRMEAERHFAGHAKQGKHRGRRESLGQGEPSLAEAYALLGLSASATDADLKRAYRRLMSQHHPDKLVAKGLPDSMVRLATDKTQKIRQAYDVISRSKKL